MKSKNLRRVPAVKVSAEPRIYFLLAQAKIAGIVVRRHIVSRTIVFRAPHARPISVIPIFTLDSAGEIYGCGAGPIHDSIRIVTIDHFALGTCLQFSQSFRGLSKQNQNNFNIKVV